MTDPNLGTKAETPDTDKGRSTAEATEAYQPAEGMEGRHPAEGNLQQRTMLRTQRRARMQQELERVRQAAKKEKGCRFTALLHHIYQVDRLREAYLRLKRSASPGVDGQTWQQYGEELEANLQNLSERLKRGAYRAKPVRRAYIQKAEGGRRPLGVPTLEDKIVQGATTEVLNAIYEVDFLGFSYGFRPGRSQHMALDALCVAIWRERVAWVLDADIRGFFDTIDHDWLIKFVEHRIGDQRVVRLIQKWLKAGVLEDGEQRRSEEGTPQGGSISPLLANIYLHYVFDLWAHQWRRKHCQGRVSMVRYADDIVVGFEHHGEAEQFLQALGQRFAKFGLKLHPDKTRLIEFGHFAQEDRRRRGQGKPETFNFLGFTYICGQSRQGSGEPWPRGCARNWPRSRSASSAGDMTRFRVSGHGCNPSCGDTTGTTGCHPTIWPSTGSGGKSRCSGIARSHAVARKAACPGLRWNGSRSDGCPRPRSITLMHLCASTPLTKAGAECVSSARSDLCGGRRETGVPTAIPRSGRLGMGSEEMDRRARPRQRDAQRPLSSQRQKRLAPRRIERSSAGKHPD
jgi:RNA-directed DNA polymerase